MQWKTRAKDIIYSKPGSDKYRDEYERIFNKEKESEEKGKNEGIQN